MRATAAGFILAAIGVAVWASVMPSTTVINALAGPLSIDQLDALEAYQDGVRDLILVAFGLAIGLLTAGFYGWQVIRGWAAYRALPKDNVRWGERLLGGTLTVGFMWLIPRLTSGLGWTIGGIDFDHGNYWLSPLDAGRTAILGVALICAGHVSLRALMEMWRMEDPLPERV